jgi:hypothetical protein
MSGDDWIKILPVYAGAAIAVFGVWRWRVELHGKADFELARRCLSAVYDVRNAISNVRDEFAGPDFDKKRKYLFRKLSRLDIQLQETEVLWGRELIDSSKRLKEAVRTLLFNLNRQRRADEYDQYRAKLIEKGEYDKIDSIVWGFATDEFGQKVVAAVRECEEVLRRRMRRSTKSWRVRWLTFREAARPHVKRVLDSLFAK